MERTTKKESFNGFLEFFAVFCVICDAVVNILCKNNQ